MSTYISVGFTCPCLLISTFPTLISVSSTASHTIRTHNLRNLVTIDNADLDEI